MKQAVILAGGKGTRLRERLGDLPKSLVDIAGIPLLERQINILKKYDYTNIIILVNYQAFYIEKFCKQEKFKDIDIIIFNDGEPQGTSGATLKIFDRLHDQVLIIYGDTLFDIDLNRLEKFHKKDSKIAGTLFLHPNDHPEDSDIVELDISGYVTKFHPYPHPKDALLPNLVNAALYILNTAIFKKYVNSKNPSDFAKNLFPYMLANGEKFLGYSTSEYIKDAGTPERLDKVVYDLSIGIVERANLSHPQKAVFIDRDGTLNAEVGKYITTPELLNIYHGTGGALNKLNSMEWRTILITNQPVIARGECTLEQLGKIHAKLEMEMAKSKAHFDKIYICPHHPDKGFTGELPELKIYCSCRKPRAGMFLQAKKDLNIDLSKSWHIGDSTADLGAAINAGVSSITVETGYGGLDDKYSYQPEFSAPSFPQAVDFILHDYPVLTLKIKELLLAITSQKNWFIGGMSRSGKSTIANIIKRELKIKSIGCHVISLDRWLLDSDKRGAMVYERYDLPEIFKTINIVSKLNRNNSIILNLPNYSKRSNKMLYTKQSVQINGDDIILWEGVVANYIANELNKNAQSIYIKSDENNRRLRIFREYHNRGYSEKKIIQLIEEREHTEHAWIKSQIESTNIVIYL
jgi:D,D-heptose 1,7-bisphosphate phosphatase